MSPAKVTLSAKELELVSDTSWILTKNGIIEKVYGLFGSTSKAYSAMLDKKEMYDKAVVLAASPKISRGEQYEGLPWVMLDQPRYYKKESSFGIRSFFWWGHGFSISLQLSGKFKEVYTSSIEKYFAANKTAAQQWLAGIGDDEWQHHFREDNYIPVANMQEKFSARSFIKITKRYPLHAWDQVETLLSEGFGEIMNMLEQ